MSREPRTNPAVRTAIATVCLSGTLEDKLDAAASAGFDGVEIFEPDLVAATLSPRAIATRCAELGLTIDLYQPLRDLDSTDPVRVAANLRRLERKFDVMEQLGTSTVLVCSSVSPDAVTDDDRLAAQLHAAAERAHARGMRLAYEALAWGRHVHTYEHSWRIVAAADHPALGVCLDSFHILSRGSDPAGVAAIPREKVFFLQLADAPNLSMDVLQWSRHHRLFPGQGAFDLPGFLLPVLAAGYRGPLSLEVFNDVFRQTDPARTAVDGRRSLLALAEATAERATRRPEADVEPDVRSIGITTGRATHLAAEIAPGTPDIGITAVTPQPEDAPPGLAEGTPVSRKSRPRAAERVVPWAPDPVAAPAPRLDGHAFVELAARPAEADLLTRTLAGLGFTRTGRHRTKPVDRWERGGARILVNAGGTGSAELAAIALESADPQASARRAQRLCVPLLPPDRGPDEADLAAVAAPDGTSLFFCRTDAPDGTGWSGDFVTTGHAPALGDGVTGIDHIGLTQPFDWLDEAVLFYRSVLGLTPAAQGEFAAPFGLVRSRALTDARRRVRLALTVSLLRRGDWAPAVADPQYVALATDDVVAAARAARAAGVPLLAVPDNYYDDLDARIVLPPATLAAYRDLGVVVSTDATPGSGALLQVFTELLGGRLFLALVQRVGAHDGYGWTDAPVRMAAHRRARAARTAAPTLADA